MAPPNRWPFVPVRKSFVKKYLRFNENLRGWGRNPILSGLSFTALQSVLSYY